MHIQILKNWRTALAVLLLAVVVNWQIIHAATEDELDTYSNSNYDNFEEAVVAYHAKINNVMNEKIGILMNTPTEDLDVEYTTDCTPENVSTYCVAEVLVDEYIKFVAGIDSHAGEYEQEVGVFVPATEVGDILFERGTMIEMEKDAAFRAMDTALAIYNELQITYPVHQQYLILIETLEAYNTELTKWRDAIYEWPGDFIDVSTNKCS